MIHRLRPILAKVLILSTSVSITLVAAEVLLRLAGIAGPGGVATVSERNFDLVPGIYDPHQERIDRRVPELPFRVRINHLGYRGPDFPLSKVESEVRILMAGDSFTFGDFVDDHETLPAHVQRFLQCEKPVTVINAGKGGTTISTQRHLIERGLVLSPDLVILTFYENDFADLETPHWRLFEENRAARSRFPLSLTYPILRNLALWRVIQTARERWRSRHRLDNVQASAVPRQDDSTLAARQAALRSEYTERLAELSAFLRSRDVEFVLKTYPSHLTLRSGARSADLIWIEQIARQLGIETIEAWEPLATSGSSIEELYALPHDGHPRPHGYNLVAKHLVHELLQGVLGDVCSHVDVSTRGPVSPGAGQVTGD